MKPSFPIPGPLGAALGSRRPGARLLLELDLTRGLLESPPASPVEALRARFDLPNLRRGRLSWIALVFVVDQLLHLVGGGD